MLVLQALNKLLEPEVVVRVRKVDLVLVKDILTPAAKRFTDVYGRAAPAIKIDETNFLPPPPTAADASEEVASWYVAVHSSLSEFWDITAAEVLISRP